MTDLTDARILTLWQPWATLWADPTLPKTIETRSWSTDFRGWVLVHAAKQPPTYGDCIGEATVVGGPSTPAVDWSMEMGHHDGIWHRRVIDSTHALPLGAVVGAVYVDDCIPIIAVDTVKDQPWGGQHRPYIFDNGRLWAQRSSINEATNIDADLPYGDYTPGRYGWTTSDRLLLPEPIPWKGAQGLRRAPGELIAQIESPHA